MERQEHFPPDMSLVLGAGPPPTSSVRTARAAWAYHATNNSWSALPSLPFGMESGPKLAPVVRGRYVLLFGIQQRISFRFGHGTAWRQQGGRWPSGRHRQHGHVLCVATAFLVRV